MMKTANFRECDHVPLPVPTGHYFMLGDNRMNLPDSRGNRCHLPRAQSGAKSFESKQVGLSISALARNSASNLNQDTGGGGGGRLMRHRARTIAITAIIATIAIMFVGSPAPIALLVERHSSIAIDPGKHKPFALASRAPQSLNSPRSSLGVHVDAGTPIPAAGTIELMDTTSSLLSYLSATSQEVPQVSAFLGLASAASGSAVVLASAVLLESALAAVLELVCFLESELLFLTPRP